jgi:hypothetical protein
MNYSRITYIYGLYEFGGQIKYIGKSDNPQKRLRDHRNDRTNSYKACWVKSVLSKGGEIGIKIIAVVDQRIWKEKEVFYINEYRKSGKIVNLTDGGDGTLNNIYNKCLSECKYWIYKNKPTWVNTMKDYFKWSKMSEFPKFLPKAPNRVFNDWVNWGDYLGTGNIQKRNRINHYLTYEDAKIYLKENYTLNSSLEFRKGKFPLFIPKKPQNVKTG